MSVFLPELVFGENMPISTIIILTKNLTRVTNMKNRDNEAFNKLPDWCLSDGIFNYDKNAKYCITQTSNCLDHSLL